MLCVSQFMICLFDVQKKKAFLRMRLIGICGLSGCDVFFSTLSKKKRARFSENIGH